MIKSYAAVTAEADSAPNGPKIGAIFDFDGTIMHGYSATAFLRAQLVERQINLREFTQLLTLVTRFGLGDIGFSALVATAAQFLRNMPEQEYLEFARRVYKDSIAKKIYPESRALIEAHLAKGHTVAIVSSATPYQVMPAAQELGIEHVYCTELELEDGHFTGRIVSPPCFGYGKVRAAHKLAEKTGITLENTYFYSDSDDDIELLESVGHPRPLNPNKPLKRIATSRDWPIQSFSSRGKTKLSSWARSIAATGSLATSFAAGLPILALTGSRRKMQNFSFALFSETASALIGMDMEIRGEAHLWSQRPAVFIFNHQSKADVLVVLRLLRRDLAGVGKKEIRYMPVIGQVMELGGAVLIDRKNSKSAIAAMQPLVDVLQDEGKSVVLAPEGTRSTSTRLLPFKKGAFHLAMQAGVPIVPIVIHNSIDVAPRGQFVFRPATVEVDVLEPIDTADWHADTVDEHVAMVRQLFLKTLGQTDARPKRAKKKRRSKKKKEA
ncbi:MAG: HAD-IB family hydrolase [Pseudomonadota bacterium]